MPDEYNLKDYKKSDDWTEQHPGKPTGKITKLVDAPIKWLLTLPGLRGEHKVLHVDMSKVQKLAKLVIKPEFEKENPIEIGVQHDGKAHVDDGNHRIKACKVAGKETYKTKITFYGGGEDHFDLDKVLKKYAWKELYMSKEKEHVEVLKNLVAKAKLAIQTGLNHAEVIAEINKLADAGTAEDTDNFGTPTDQEYQALEGAGNTDEAGENDPDKGKQRRTGPRDDNDMMQEASSNKPCPTCGMPTDQCKCMKPAQPRIGNNPVNTHKNLDPELDPTKKRAAFDMVVGLIKDNARMTREASHMEEIEIPFSDLNLKNGIDYHMTGRHQEVTMLVDKYLRKNVYLGNRRYTVARIEQDKSKFYVKVIIFDQQIEHDAAFNDTNQKGLHKLSNIATDKIQKTAWKKRLTEVIGNDDNLGYVKCPLESNFAVFACGTCPLAGNASTYIEDGFVECHFSDMSSYLGQGITVKEHRLLDNSSNT